MKNFLTYILVLFTKILFAQTENESIGTGNEYYRQSQFDLAEKHYRIALDKNPASVTAKHNLANALYRQKKFKEATEVLGSISQNEKDKNVRSVAYYNEGVIHTKEKDLEASIESYKNALRLNPDDKQARENLQKALLEQKQKQQQQKQEQKQNNKPQANINQNQAERKLEQLREKEKQTQQRQNEKDGTPQPKDW